MMKLSKFSSELIMAKGSSTLNILGGLVLKPAKSASVPKKNNAHDAATADKKKKHAPAQTINSLENPTTAPALARNLIKPKGNELNLGDELKAILTPKKGGPTLAPKS